MVASPASGTLTTEVKFTILAPQTTPLLQQIASILARQLEHGTRGLHHAIYYVYSYVLIGH